METLISHVILHRDKVEEGVLLDYTISGNEVLNPSDILYGILNTGEKCTLIGRFNAQYSGFRGKEGLNTRFGKTQFAFMLTGVFIDINDSFNEITFRLINMQEFFYPKGFKHGVKYADVPILSLSTSYGKLIIDNSATFSFLADGISSQIYSQNQEALQELQLSFKQIEQKYQDSFFMFRNDFAYQIRLNFNIGFSIRDTYAQVMNIANLFALLMYGPIYPESIRIDKKGDDANQLSIDVFPSIVLDQRTVDLCKIERSHFNMPITVANVDLSATITAWLKISRDYSAMVSSIQHETGFRDEHSIHGELVLYATQLESIGYANGVDNSDRYEYSLREYASDKIIASLKKHFQIKGDALLGQHISDLRNEIAHVGKPRKYLNLFSLMDLIRISRNLHLIITGYMLSKLGAAKEIIQQFQNEIAERL